jgi:hypothetical protein
MNETVTSAATPTATPTATLPTKEELYKQVEDLLHPTLLFSAAKRAALVAALKAIFEGEHS